MATNTVQSAFESSDMEELPIAAVPMDVSPTNTITDDSNTDDNAMETNATGNRNEASNSPNAQPSNSTANDDKDNEIDSMYVCNICLELARNAVISMCGHLFCWPCLYRWMEAQPNQLCPVCKASIAQGRIVPLYGRNSAVQDNMSAGIPPRPTEQRFEPEQSNSFQTFGLGENIPLSLGIGAFPFGFFMSLLNIGGARDRQAMYYDDEDLLLKIILYIGFLCFMWLLIG